jgi:hypothetical protein
VVVAVESNGNDENTNHRYNTTNANDDDDDDGDNNNNNMYDDNNDDESFVTANTHTNTMTGSPHTPGQSNDHNNNNNNNALYQSLTNDELVMSSSSSSRLYNTIFRTNFLPDDTIKFYNILFAENAFAIKLCKFTLFTFVSIWLMFYFVRFMVRRHCAIHNMKKLKEKKNKSS